MHNVNFITVSVDRMGKSKKKQKLMGILLLFHSIIVTDKIRKLPGIAPS